MGDVHTPEARSRNMAAVRSKDTKPEMRVRRIAHGLGCRFRLHVRSLPGCPDLVFRSRRKIVVVHGCFWHRHGCARCGIPETHRDFWEEKLEGNRRRDTANLGALRRAGWKVLVVWECQTKDPKRLAARLARFLGVENGLTN